jgi:hypothetical protein
VSEVEERDAADVRLRVVHVAPLALGDPGATGEERLADVDHLGVPDRADRAGVDRELDDQLRPPVRARDDNVNVVVEFPACVHQVHLEDDSLVLDLAEAGEGRWGREGGAEFQGASGFISAASFFTDDQRGERLTCLAFALSVSVSSRPSATIDALEFTRSGEQVVLGARGQSISAVEDEPLDGQIFNVFTLRGGRIVRIDDYRGRREALTAAGVVEDADWR